MFRYFSVSFSFGAYFQTISAETAPNIYKQKQQQQSLSDVWSPDGVFTMSVSAVLLLCSIFAKPSFSLLFIAYFQTISAAAAPKIEQQQQ